MTDEVLCVLLHWKCIIQIQSCKKLLIHFINTCRSNMPHLSWSSNSIPSGAHWNKQHHMCWVLFLDGILNFECSLCCVLLHIAVIWLCAHTVILKQYAPQSARFQSGTSMPHCSPLIDANRRPSWRSRFAVVGKSEMGRNADMCSLGSLPSALCSQLQFGQVELAPWQSSSDRVHPFKGTDVDWGPWIIISHPNRQATEGNDNGHSVVLYVTVQLLEIFRRCPHRRCFQWLMAAMILWSSYASWVISRQNTARLTSQLHEMFITSGAEVMRWSGTPSHLRSLHDVSLTHTML